MNMELSDLDSEHGRSQLSPHVINKHNRTFVLLGSCILQLPIWGLPMTYGIFQDAYSHSDTLHSSQRAAGVVGTTMNGVMYLSMPVLFTVLGCNPWVRWRRSLAISGIILSSIAILASSWASEVWHLVLLQGILAAFGNTLLFSPTTLYLDEWFGSERRATAYAATLSSKNVVGTACPIISSALISHLGIPWALRVWACITLITGLFGILLIPKNLPPAAPRRDNDLRHVPWAFLKHQTFYIHTIANIVFSSGYALPQTYVSSYARDILGLSSLNSSLMLTVLNAPGIISCIGFGLLSDKLAFSATANTLISALGSSLCALFLWGFGTIQTPAFLIVFSLTYGFFAGGYSSTWGGWIKDFEREAALNNEAVHTGMLYGLINGARGVGYVVGGVTGFELVKAGAIQHSSSTRPFGYDTKYGAVILFTGLSAAIGGWSVLWGGYRKAKILCGLF